MSAESENPRRLDVSVIVPLEFHRGLAIECIQGWASAQTHPRDRYQVVIAAPDTLQASLRSEIQLLLQPPDRLECFPFHHDMPLAARGASLAGGDWLLFTESHCLPEPHALAQLTATAAAHPEWAALSGASTPIAHNLLSEIEAEIYDSDIRDKLANHAWLKVMDQCFLIRREAYFGCGGLEPEYGHFAEWLFAATLCLAGSRVGYDPTAVIRHYYIGERSDLETFTLDFAQGEIKFAAERHGDPRAAFFPRLPELEEHRERTRGDLWQMARSRLAAFPRLVARRLARQPGVSLSRILGDLADWLLKAVGQGRAHAGIAVVFARRRLERAIRRCDREAARAAFVEWFSRLVRKARMRYLHASAGIERLARNHNFSRASRWDAENHRGAELLGFYDAETRDGRPFRWSAYGASVYLPLHEGRYRLRLDWEPVRLLRREDLLGVEFDGRLVPEEKLSMGETHLTIEVESESRGWHRLSWTVVPMPAAGDRRLLGLPVSSIRWFALDAPAVSSPVESTLVARERPVYFLHLHKCAGTTTRLLLDNAFSSSAVFEPYAGGYYPEDLEDNPGTAFPYAFYRGHFGWDLPLTIPDRELTVVTMVREPIDRILSLFHYSQQIGQVGGGLTAVEWVEHFLGLRYMMTGHFVAASHGRDRKRRGGDLRSASLSLLPEARAHLASCRVVGLSEHLEDSINLLAWQLGFLPPVIIPRNNPTLRRARTEELTEDARARLAHMLEADISLYREGQELFRAAMEDMRKELSAALGPDPETMAVRSFLRERYVERMGETGARDPDPTTIEWRPDDVFHGENLHEREQHEGRGLRWTGPNETTRFLVYLGRSRSWAIQIRLHPATPPPHAAAARLRVNGLDVPVQTDASALSAQIPGEATGLSAKGVASFELTAPVTRGASEFRMLGLALLGITLQAD